MPLAGPSNADDVRKVVEQRLAALESESGLQETVTVEWRGQQQKPLQVISMPIDLLYYNPNTHRIRAQRSLDAARDRDLHDDPYGSAGQAYLHKLLMGTPSDPSRTDPSFDALKEDLRAHGQSEPGIITRDGVLINGNTRRAALKALEQEHIRVGVLPADAGIDDRQSIELSLQLRRDHKRDYSFMNLLLAIDERVEANRPAAEIQQDFRITAKTFEKYRWILDFVNRAIERSKVPGAAGAELSMRLINFESDQGQLDELHRTYMSLKAKSPDDAEALLEQRLLAMVLDKSKTDLRLIEPDFAERYMQSSIPSVTAPAPPVRIPGTSITAAAPSAKVEGLRALTTKILQAKAVELYPTAATPEALAEATRSLTTLDTALDSALDKAGKNSRVTKKRYAAAERISDATEDIELAAAAVSEARSTGNFDLNDLDEALSALRSSLGKLAQIVARGADAGTLPAGVAWLSSAAVVTDPSS